MFMAAELTVERMFTGLMIFVYRAAQPLSHSMRAVRLLTENIHTLFMMNFVCRCVFFDDDDGDDAAALRQSFFPFDLVVFLHIA